MGLGFVNEEAVKAEHTVILFVVAGIVLHFLTKSAILSIDSSAFAIFVGMCLAGFFALKTAQEIFTSIQERKIAYETVNSNSYISAVHEVSPIAFNSSSKISKYAATAYMKKI